MKPLASLLIGILSCMPASAAEEDLADSFKGNVVLISLDPDGAAFPLVDAKVQPLSGRKFIVGVGADSNHKGDWVKGTKLKIALDRVAFIAIYTPKEWESARAMHNWPSE